jgi:hypothetical protein
VLHNRERFEQWLPALFDGEFDWDFLLPAFKGTKIRPMDIDCAIERKGCILIFETKSAGKKIELGQQLSLTALWHKGITVIHLEGKTPATISGYAIYSGWAEQKAGMIGDLQIKAANAFDLLFVVRSWFCKVDGLPRLTREQWDNELWLWDYEGGLPAALKALLENAA